MKLNFFLKKGCLIPNLKTDGNEITSVVNKMVDVLYANSEISSETIKREEVVDALLKREREQTTAVGDGFAFPHARVEGIENTYMAIGISKEGIDFHSMDGASTHFFIMTLTPPLNPGILLKLRASIIRFMSLPSIQESLLKSNSTEEIWNLIEENNVEVISDIMAKDIMRPQIGVIAPDTTLKNAARALHWYHADSLPIVDLDNTFLGEISCFDLFFYGMPDFFSNLHQVSFVKHMDPFEKYFHVDDFLKISELKRSKEAPIIPSNATLMEIVFEMTVKNKELLYVVENNKLLGTLDRYSIIDKILVAV